MKREKFFTLLEVLLALTLICLLAGSAFASLHIAFKSRDSAEDKLSLVRKSEFVFKTLGRDLFNCPKIGGMSLFFQGSNGEGFGAEQGTLTLYTQPSRLVMPKPNGGVEKVFFELSAVDNEVVLLRKSVGNVLATTEPEPVVETVCRGVSEFALEFFDGVEWTDSYDSQLLDGRLPVAVKCELVLKNSDDEEKTFTRIFKLPCGSAEEVGSAQLRR